MDHEEAFAEEAQEQALLADIQRTEIIDTPSRYGHHDSDQGEESPLLSPLRRRTSRGSQPGAAAGDETDIDEPWAARGQSWRTTPSIFWLLPAFFPFCIAFGGIIVPKTYLILDLICEKYLSDQAARDPNFKFMPVLIGGENPQCRNPRIQSLVANFNLYQTLLSGIFSAIVSPHLGSLSDRVGRKKVIVCASAGGLVAEIITIIVGQSAGRVSVYWILLGAFIDGMCGSFTAAMALAFAYAADCTVPERRNVSFGYFHGTLFLGIALGPILAAWLIDTAGTVMVVFYLTLGCHLFFIAFVLLFVPESLSPARQAAAREKRRFARANSPHKSWRARLRAYNPFKPLWVLLPTGPGSSPALRQNMVMLAAIDTMMFGVAMGTLQIIIIYAEFRFGWTAVNSSMYLSVVNICRVIGLVVILPLLTRVFRGPMQVQSAGHKGSDLLDIYIIRGAVLFDLLGYIGYALTPSGPIMVLSGMVASLGGIGPPTLQSSLTKHIPADRTGQVLGASGLLHALARVVAPTIFNLIYSKTVGTYAGIVFICLASTFVVIFVLSWFLKPNVYLGSKFHAGQEGSQENS